MRPSVHALFPAAVALFAAWTVAETVGWPPKTALYPRVVGLPLLVLAAAETLLVLRRGEAAAEPGDAVDVALQAPISPEVAAARRIRVMGWVGAFFLAVYLIGFTRAIPLFLASYLRVEARTEWLRTLLLATLAWAAFDLLFVRLLHLPLPPGVVWRWG